MFLKGFCVLLISMCTLQIANCGITKKDDFIPLTYPGPTNEGVGTRYGSDDDLPEACRNLTYCTIKPKNYPQKLFDNMFKGQKQAAQPTLVVVASAVDRFGEDESDNCETTVTYEPLYKVRSKRGWHTVIQAPVENYIQKVRLETCVENNKSCFTGAGFTSDIVTFCKQKYSTWEFLVASDTGSEKVQAELPICCSCHYKIVDKK